LVATIGTPAIIASSNTFDEPSLRDGRTNMSAMA
jgi:hypothetical protein